MVADIGHLALSLTRPRQCDSATKRCKCDSATKRCKGDSATKRCTKGCKCDS